MKAKLLKKLRKEAKRAFIVSEFAGYIWVNKRGEYTSDVYPINRKGEKPRIGWANLDEVERDLPVFRTNYILEIVRQMKLRREIKRRKQNGSL